MEKAHRVPYQFPASDSGRRSNGGYPTSEADLRTSTPAPLLLRFSTSACYISSQGFLSLIQTQPPEGALS